MRQPALGDRPIELFCRLRNPHGPVNFESIRRVTTGEGTPSLSVAGQPVSCVRNQLRQAASSPGGSSADIADPEPVGERDSSSLREDAHDRFEAVGELAELSVLRAGDNVNPIWPHRGACCVNDRWQ